MSKRSVLRCCRCLDRAATNSSSVRCPSVHLYLQEIASEVFAKHILHLTEQNRGLKRKAEQVEVETERLEQRLQHIECNVCRDANNNVLLKCGHMICSSCLEKLEAGVGEYRSSLLPTCPWCRKGVEVEARF